MLSPSGTVFIHIFKNVDTAAGLGENKDFAFAHRTEYDRRSFGIFIHLSHQDTPASGNSRNKGQSAATLVGFLKVVFCRVEFWIDFFRF